MTDVAETSPTGEPVARTGDRSSLDGLLRPAGIALVGASARQGSYAATTLAGVIDAGYPGRVYPVNPKLDEVAGLTCYARVSAIPEQVDLALVMVPAAAVGDVIEDCVASNVPAAAVFSSGFGELGGAGADAQQRIAELARAGGLRLLGPNCQGLFHAPSHLVASFSAALRTAGPPSTGVAFVGQSGALGGAFLAMARERSVGLTSWVTTGNQSDLTATEIGNELIEDDDVRLLALYLESIPHGADWQRLTERAAGLGKPVVVLRAGRSEAGRRAATAHTGAMIKADAGFGLLSRRAGVVEVSDVRTLVQAVIELSTPRRMRGRSVAVVTSSGGAGGLAADHLDANDLRLAELTDDTRAALAPLVPSFGSVRNPVDVTAQAFNAQQGAVGEICRQVLRDGGVDALGVVLTNVVDEQAVAVAADIAATADRSTKPVTVAWLASSTQTAAARQLLVERGIGVYDSIAEQVGMLRLLSDRADRPTAASPPMAEPAAPSWSARAARLADGLRTDADGLGLLDLAGIARPPGAVAATPQEARKIARDLATPVACKVVSAQLRHKTDVGGVRLDVAPEAVASVYPELVDTVRSAIPDAVVDGVLVQAMAEPGVELIVGVAGGDNGYPPILTVGVGGIYTELYADVAATALPVSHAEVDELLRRLRWWPMLDGYRGRPPADVPAAVSAIVAVGELAAALGPQLAELEINPLIVHRHGATAADILIRLDS